MEEATVSVAEAFRRARATQETLTSALRLFGFLLMWGGLDAFFDPLYTLFRSLPAIHQQYTWGKPQTLCCSGV